MTNEKVIHIDPDAYYSVSEIIENGLLPWIGHRNTLKIRIESNLKLFKPIILKSENKVSYKIKGETLIELNALPDKGQLIKC